MRDLAGVCRRMLRGVGADDGEDWTQRNYNSRGKRVAHLYRHVSLGEALAVGKVRDIRGSDEHRRRAAAVAAATSFDASELYLFDLVEIPAD